MWKHEPFMIRGMIPLPPAPGKGHPLGKIATVEAAASSAPPAVPFIAGNVA